MIKFAFEHTFELEIRTILTRKKKLVILHAMDEDIALKV